MRKFGKPTHPATRATEPLLQPLPSNLSPPTSLLQPPTSLQPLPSNLLFPVLPQRRENPSIARPRQHRKVDFFPFHVNRVAGDGQCPARRSKGGDV